MSYQEIPDAFPDDYRDSYPVVGRTCVCGDDEDQHDEDDGVCMVRGCDCLGFRDDLRDE